MENKNEKSIVNSSVHLEGYLRRAVNRIRWKLKQLLIGMRTSSRGQSNESFEVRSRRVSLVIRNLVDLARETLQQEVAERDSVLITAKVASAQEERRKRRDRLIEVGMEAYEELRKLSGSEEASREAEYRMRAYMVMARVGVFNAAVIKDQEAEDLTNLIMEVEETNAELEEELEKVREKQQELEEIGQGH